MVVETHGRSREGVRGAAEAQAASVRGVFGNTLGSLQMQWGVLLCCDAACSVACPGRAVEVLVGLSTTAGL